MKWKSRFLYNIFQWMLGKQVPDALKQVLLVLLNVNTLYLYIFCKVIKNNCFLSVPAAKEVFFIA